jgi:hypothetical protein
MRELQEILFAMAGQRDKVADRLELLLDMGERIAKAFSREFSCRSDEIAILLLTGDGHHLRFVAPRQLVGLGSIPVTKRDSIAVAVLARRTGELTNNVPGVKHVSFFESVKLRDKPAPIQKMITVPILWNGHPIGVGQVSRKGETSREAGPDFSEADLQYSQEIFNGIASYLVAARPPGF